VIPRYILIWIAGVLIFQGILLTFSCNAEETTDLWFLVSSYEDPKISSYDLAIFLTAHGYQATPREAYVAITISGKEFYLDPNGASPGLADILMAPPKRSDETYPSAGASESKSQLARASNSLEIKKDTTYVKTNSREFRETIRNSALFPLTPYGMCFEGSSRMGRIYTRLGYNVIYMYNPDNPKGRGHEWVLVEDDKNGDSWQAVDSYYGIMDLNDYYRAPYSFPKHEDLKLILPQWQV
jgi:hypothetical protein